AAAAPLLLDFHCCRPLLLDFHCCRPLLLDFHCCRPLLLDFHCCRLSFLDVTAAFALLLSSFSRRRLASHLSVRRCYCFYAVTSTSAQPATVPLPPRSRTISFSSLFWHMSDTISFSSLFWHRYENTTEKFLY
ncbi:hypothetical protein CICLE_v10023682mg, partial [Citrus x clementina]